MKRIRKWSGRGLFVLVWAVVGPGSEAGSLWASQPTPSQQRQIKRLVNDFRAARRASDQQAQNAAVQQAIGLGPAAVDTLFGAINQELYPQVKRYDANFQAQAVRRARQAISAANLQQVARLRATVLNLRRNVGLTGDQLRQQVLPAVNQLQRIFAVDPAVVVAGSPPLVTERARLSQLGLLWDRCAVYLYNQVPTGILRVPSAPSFEQYLRGEEELIVGMAAPMPNTTRRVLLENAKLVSRIDREEARAVTAMNLIRNLSGLPPLVIDLRFCASSRQNARFFSQNPRTTITTISPELGTQKIMLGGAFDGKAASEAWLCHPKTNALVLGRYQRVGVGRFRSYFAAMLK